LKTSSKSVGSKFSKDISQKSGPQGKRASIGAGAKARSTTQAKSGRKNLLSSSGRTATPSGKIGAQSHTRMEKSARVEMAYSHGPLMLAQDQRVLDVPLEERLQSRTSELLAWAKTMLPAINRSVRDARAQLQTGHQDIRNYFSQATVATTVRRGSSKRAPAGYSAARSGLTNQDGHPFFRHSPVFPGHRRQCHHLNPSDINQPPCTRIDKPQNRSRGHTCRRSGSNLSYTGIDATGLKIKFYYYGATLPETRQ
jgi:hypothetical protein